MDKNIPSALIPNKDTTVNKDIKHVICLEGTGDKWGAIVALLERLRRGERMSKIISRYVD